MGKKTPTGNWSRSTNKQRRAPQPLVLVGFGKYSLIDLMKYRDTDDEDKLVTEPFEKGWPPVYRRADICTEEEINTFKEFTTFITETIADG